MKIMRFLSVLLINKRYVYYKLLFLLFILILFTFLYVFNDNNFGKKLSKNDSSVDYSVNKKLGLYKNELNSGDDKDITHKKRLFESNSQSTIGFKVDNEFETYSEEVVDNSSVIRFGGYDRHTMKIAITVCGNQTLRQSLITLKSAVVLTKSRIHFIIMTDEINRKTIKQTILKKWPNDVLKRISFEIHLISFPNAINVEEWVKLFKPCAAQRLFLPAVFEDIDSVLYVDTDVIFLTPVDQIWGFFGQMNSSQMAGMSSESEDFASSWYHRFAKHPYVERLGVNSGVMLMNLTRMRLFGWTDYLEPYLSQYRLNIVWGDQDIINIIFHYNSDKLYKFGCNWNYRPDHCIYTRVCKEAEKSGVRIIHGNRGVFLNEKQPAFKAIYQAFENYQFGDDLSLLLNSMKSLLEKTSSTNCGKARHSFTSAFERFLNESSD